MKNLRLHWERVYKTKRPDEVSWYQPHLARSLAMILRTSVDLGASVIDIGGGTSTLVDDLLVQRFRNVSVLDISRDALKISQTRLGPKAKQIVWIESDITRADLPSNHYDLWHDRAVFHFLTQPQDRRSYVRLLLHSLKPGGNVILATFGPQGPTRCSGLGVVRYSAETLLAELGDEFKLAESLSEDHLTPFQTIQNFIYCRFIRN